MSSPLATQAGVSSDAAEPGSLAAVPARRRKASAPTGLRYPLWVSLTFLAPFGILFLVFVLVPAVFGIWISLHDWDFLLPGKPFVGLDNYTALFDSSSVNYPTFWNAMGNTLLFTVASVPFLVVLPLLLAILLHRKFPGRTFFRAAFFAPYVLGVAVIGPMWRYLLDPQFGAVNGLLGALGLPNDLPWTTGQPWAWIALIGVTIWWTMGFNAVIYLAGLGNIPVDHYEAAALDGANAWQRFRHITIPGLRPVLVFVITTTILASANMFGQSYIITKGGPGESTRTAIMAITDLGLTQYRMGAAAAMSYVLAFFLAIVSVINFVLMREK